MIEIPRIETERLILRAHRESDIPVETAFFASERSRFVGGPSEHPNGWRSVTGILGHWALRGYGFFAVELKETGEYCGRAGPLFPDTWPEPEIGWTLMNGFEGKGIAFEAAIAGRQYAYQSLGWTTAISLVDPQNTRSAALAKRMGAWRDEDYMHPTLGRAHIYRHPGPDALNDEGLPHV